ncbi:MAG: hypothetical protein O2910_05265 [Proteobacteria bacterium]|nr:hypothetical protein [Pseudomonadota bacterium]
MIKGVSHAEGDRALSILALAFVADPATRFLFPDADQYLETFPHFARAFGGAAVGIDRVY